VIVGKKSLLVVYKIKKEIRERGGGREGGKESVCTPFSRERETLFRGENVT